MFYLCMIKSNRHSTGQLSDRIASLVRLAKMPQQTEGQGIQTLFWTNVEEHVCQPLCFIKLTFTLTSLLMYVKIYLELYQ